MPPLPILWPQDRIKSGIVSELLSVRSHGLESVTIGSPFRPLSMEKRRTGHRSKRPGGTSAKGPSALAPAPSQGGGFPLQADGRYGAGPLILPQPSNGHGHHPHAHPGHPFLPLLPPQLLGHVGHEMLAHAHAHGHHPTSHVNVVSRAPGPATTMAFSTSLGVPVMYNAPTPYLPSPLVGAPTAQGQALLIPNPGEWRLRGVHALILMGFNQAIWSASVGPPQSRKPLS
jgi:hypothetical protein